MKKTNHIPALSFHALTKFYDFIIAHTMPEKKFREALVKESFEKQDNLNALEFGIGTASNSIMAQKLFPNHKITGLDVDVKVLEIARSKINNAKESIELIQYDGRQSNLAGSSFDLVFSALVFHHLNKARKELAFKEIQRLLRNNGRLVFIDWGKPTNLLTTIGFFFLRLFDGWENTRDNFTGYYLKMLEVNGFEPPKKVRSFDTIFGTLELMKTRKL